MSFDAQEEDRDAEEASRRTTTSALLRRFIQLLKNLRTDIVRLIAGTAAGIGGRIYVKRSIVLRSIKKQGRGASG